MAPTDKKCAICSHVFSDNSLQCPKCGSGVFEPQKTRSQIHAQESESLSNDVINTDHFPSPETKNKRSWLNRLFGGKHKEYSSASNSYEPEPTKVQTGDFDKRKKSLYYQGTLQIDLLAILLQSYSDSLLVAIDRDTANNILTQVIPGIEQCMREEIRIQLAKDYNDAIENSVVLSKEYKNSEGTCITGLISAKQNDVPITISITLLVNGIRSITGNTMCIIMKTPTSWAANLKVM